MADRFAAANRVFLVHVMAIASNSGNEQAASELAFTGEFQVLETYKGVVAKTERHHWVTASGKDPFAMIERGQRWLIFDTGGTWAGPCTSSRMVRNNEMPALRTDMRELSQVRPDPHSLIASDAAGQPNFQPAKRSLATERQPAARYYAGERLTIAERSLEHGQVRAAERALHRALLQARTDRQRQHALMLLAQIAERNGRYKAAEGYLREAVRLDGNDPEAVRALAALLRTKQSAVAN